MFPQALGTLEHLMLTVISLGITEKYQIQVRGTYYLSPGASFPM